MSHSSSPITASPEAGLGTEAFTHPPAAYTLIMNAVTRLFELPPGTRDLLLVVTTAVTTISLFYLGRYVLWPKWTRIIHSPLRASFPRVSEEAMEKQVYRPDCLPGARDVSTPYGTIRVYEWGNPSGPKILLVHGISTPCITLAPLAQSLAARGCRVMTFDLFGRGFTDGVGDLPHDERLYASNILLALASSPLPWTGHRAFHLVGYSLGGALTASFTASFPDLIDSLVLLAPAGLISAADFGVVARVMFRSGLVPERILAMATRKKLQQPIAAGSKKGKEAMRKQVEVGGGGPDGAGKPVKATGRDDGERKKSDDHHQHRQQHEHDTNRQRPSLKREPTATGKIADVLISSETTRAENPPPDSRLERQVDEYVRWMVAHHAGFVPAFMSCVRHAPLTDQHPTWEKLGQLLRVDTTSSSSSSSSSDKVVVGSGDRSEKRRMAVLLARKDEIIDCNDYERDGLPLLGGTEQVHWKVMDGTHDYVMTHTEDILRELDGFWGLKAPEAAEG